MGWSVFTSNSLIRIYIYLYGATQKSTANLFDDRIHKAEPAVTTGEHRERGTEGVTDVSRHLITMTVLGNAEGRIGGIGFIFYLSLKRYGLGLGVLE